MTIQRKKSSLFAVYFTFFIDNLCWAIVFPIFAPYFLDPENQIFSPEVSQGIRTIILGLFLMAFSLGQFLGAPLMGEYADKHGRKKALGLSVFFTLLGMMASAWSMRSHQLYFLFFARLLTGVFASSNSLCFSCMSDLSRDEKEKVKNFGYLSMIAGIAFVFGAYIGGKLSDSTLNDFFTADFPLWIAAILTALNLFFVLFGFKETAVFHPQVRFHFFRAFTNIKAAIQDRKIQAIYTVYFLFLLAWTILIQFIPVLTIVKFSFTNSEIGDLALFMGASWAVGSGYLNKILSHYLKSFQILELCLIGFTVLCAVLVFPKEIFSVVAILGSCVVCGAIGWPICTGLISSMASKQTQGKVLGLSQSVQSLATAIAPVVGGLMYHFNFSLPFFVAAGFSFLAGISYYFTLKDQ